MGAQHLQRTHRDKDVKVFFDFSRLSEQPNSNSLTVDEMTSHRVPKQWSLSSNETITSIDAWENSLKYILSLNPNFADFLTDGSLWGKKKNATPLRGFSNNRESVPAARRRTAAQKVTHLEMMLGQIVNYAPIISRSLIVKNSTSISGV